MESTMQLHGSIHPSTFAFCNSICVPHLAPTKFSHNEANATLAQLRAAEFVPPPEENTYKFSNKGQVIESPHSSQRHKGTRPKFGNRRGVYVRRNPKEATEESSEQEVHKHIWPNEEGEVELLGGLPWPQRRAAITSIQMTENLSDTLEWVGEKLQTQDLNLVLRYFGRMQKWPEVSQLFDWMKQHGKVNAASYTSFITLMGKGCQTRIALELYCNLEDEHIKSNVFVCNSMLKCLFSNGRVETAFKLFEQMKEGGLNPDIVTYSTLLAGHVKARHGYSKACKLMEDFKGTGLKFDSVMYGSLLALCASHNLDEEAETYFQQMKNEGLPANEFHYSSLLNAYAAKGKHEKAEKLIDDMKSAGLVPNKVVLTSLLKVYARSGLFEKAGELLAELDVSGQALDEMPYCLMMDGLAKAGKIHDAQKIFDEMKAKGIRSDGYSYSTMISTYSKIGNIEEVKRLEEELENIKGKYDLVVMNTLLNAYSRGRDMEYVMRTLKKMDKFKICPDRQTFSILISYFCKEKLYDLAQRTLEDMQARGHRLTEELCSSVITGLGESGRAEEAFKLYNQLKSDRHTLSKVLHEKILNILVSGRMLKEAYTVMKDNAKSISKPCLKKFVIAFAEAGNIYIVSDVFKECHSTGCKIEQDVLYVALSRYIEQGKKRELIHLLKWMKNQRYEFASSTLNSVLKKLRESGQSDVAEMLSHEFTSSGKQVMTL